MCDQDAHPGPGFLPNLQEPWQQQNRLQQLYHYALAAERVRMTQHQQHSLHHPQASPNQHHPVIPCSYGSVPHNRFFTSSPHHLFPQTNPEVSGYMALLHAQHQSRLMHQFHDAVSEPKPQQSYIGLIAMAILSSPERKLVLSDIYQHILEHHPYFRRRGPGWRNSIRHNLSLNDCFVKSGRSANGKGHYWAIHPANVEDFRRGDFRRRRAQRKVRRHMGLVADDEPDSPSPPPVIEEVREDSEVRRGDDEEVRVVQQTVPVTWRRPSRARKRQFDMESLLAPDDEVKDEEDIEVDVELVTDVQNSARTNRWSGPSLMVQSASDDRFNSFPMVGFHQAHQDRAIGRDCYAMPIPSPGSSC